MEYYNHASAATPIAKLTAQQTEFHLGNQVKKLLVFS